jgi:hypothetical protein
VLKLREEIVQTKKLGNDVGAFLILRKIDKDQLEDKLLEKHPLLVSEQASSPQATWLACRRTIEHPI